MSFHEALRPSFADYQSRVVQNCQALASVLIEEGARLVSGGTDNHLLLVDVTRWGVGGKDAETLLETAGISVNKNMLPFDERKPTDPSGIRLGSAAITTRGFDETATTELGHLIAALLKSPNDTATKARVAARVRELADAHPVYPDRPKLA